MRTSKIRRRDCHQPSRNLDFRNNRHTIREFDFSLASDHFKCFMAMPRKMQNYLISNFSVVVLLQIASFDREMFLGDYKLCLNR